MTTRAMHQHWARIKQIVESSGEIHKYDLIEQARISLSTYDKLKPWILYKFQDFVSYEKETMLWRWEN